MSRSSRKKVRLAYSFTMMHTTLELVSVACLVAFALIGDFQIARKLLLEENPVLVDNWEPVSAHPHSSFLSIVHHPHESSIQVTFLSKDRCTHPSLMGRLSGPALLSIQWQTPRETKEGIVHKGTYASPLDGTFFAEIVMIHCDARIFKGGNITNVCMEDPTRHRLTAVGATITVRKDESSKVLGYWEHKRKAKVVPLYTRAQLHGRDSLQGYSPYHFVWKNEKPIIPLQSHPVHVCFLGDSHSRQGVESFQQLDLRHQNISVSHLRTSWMSDFRSSKARMLQNEVQKCHRIIFAVAQWDFSFMQGSSPTSWEQYEQDLVYALQWLHQHAPRVPVLTRNIHFNGLGDRYWTCPPVDWRSPTAMRQVTSLVQHAVANSAYVHYVDTDFIVEPMWDSAHDWSHLNAPVSQAETLYLLSEVLQLPVPVDIGGDSEAKDK